MKNCVAFLQELKMTIEKHELVTLATELSFRLIFSLFPFIIFLMSLIGFFNINAEPFMESLHGAFPDIVIDAIQVFVVEVVDVRSPSLLSISLFVTIFSASSGFKAVIRGINKANETQEKRNFLYLRLLSIFLVLILCTAIIASIFLLVFRDTIKIVLLDFFQGSHVIEIIFGFSGNIIVMTVFFLTIIAIYQCASIKKMSFREMLPGAIVTLVAWFLVSKAFNLYINNFSRYSKIYGSVASIFVMMIWLNIISIFILLGGEINALLCKRKNKNL